MQIQNNIVHLLIGKESVRGEGSMGCYFQDENASRLQRASAMSAGIDSGAGIGGMEWWGGWLGHGSDRRGGHDQGSRH